MTFNLNVHNKFGWWRNNPLWLTSIAVSIFLIAAIWLAFAPGFMSYDSYVQFQNALTGEYADNNPVVMAYVWHLLMPSRPGPENMLIFHLSMLFMGILIWCYNLSKSPLKILIPCLFFTPWILNFSGVIWKDIGVALSLFLASGLIFNKNRTGALFAIAIPFLFYAESIRYNAILAVAPIIFFGIKFIFNKEKIVRFIVPLFITIITLFVFSFVNSAITYNFLNAKSGHLEVAIMGDEIAVISSNTGKNLMPWVKHDDIIECSKFEIFYERALCFIHKGYDPSGSLVTNNSVESTHAIWLKAISSNPALYFKIKVNNFLFFLRSPSLTPYYIWHEGVGENKYSINLLHPKLAKIIGDYVNVSAAYVPEIFKPYFWLITSLLMLFLSYFDRDKTTKDQIIALNCSGLGYFFSYFLVGVSADFRYIYWCIICTSISIVLFLSSLKLKNMITLEEK